MIQRGGGKKPGRTDPWRSRCILSASIRQLSLHVRRPEVFHGLCQLVRLRNEKGLLPTRHTFPVAGPGPTDRQRLPCEVHSPGLRAPGSGLRAPGKASAKASVNKGVALPRSQGGGALEHGPGRRMKGRL